MGALQRTCAPQCAEPRGGNRGAWDRRGLPGAAEPGVPSVGRLEGRTSQQGVRSSTVNEAGPVGASSLTDVALQAVAELKARTWLSLDSCTLVTYQGVRAVAELKSLTWLNLSPSAH